MTIKRILWAIDIRENHPKAFNASKDFLQTLNTIMPFEVDAVSVIFGEQREATQVKDQYRKQLKSILGETINETWFGKEVILVERQIPQRAAVLRLLNFAHRQDYDALLIIKHSQKKHKVNYLGSFAEMTAFLSDIPLFLINPDGVIPDKIEKILIPVEDSAKNSKDFKALFKFITPEGMRAKLFHRISLPFYFRSKVYISQFLIDQKNILLKTFRIIELMGKRAGGEIEIDIRKSTLDVADEILKEGQKGKFDLIEIMHKRKGSLGFLLGKTTRTILQNTDRPVLLFRP